MYLLNSFIMFTTNTTQLPESRAALGCSAVGKSNTGEVWFHNKRLHKIEANHRELKLDGAPLKQTYYSGSSIESVKHNATLFDIFFYLFVDSSQYEKSILGCGPLVWAEL